MQEFEVRKSRGKESAREQRERLEKEGEDREFADWQATGEIPESLRRKELIRMRGVFALANRIPRALGGAMPRDVYIHPDWASGEAAVVCVVEGKNEQYAVTADGIRNPSIETLIVSREAAPRALAEFSRPHVQYLEGFQKRESTLRVAVPKDWSIFDTNEAVKLYLLNMVRLGVPLGFYKNQPPEVWELLRTLEDISWTDAVRARIEAERAHRGEK